MGRNGSSASHSNIVRWLALFCVAACAAPTGPSPLELPQLPRRSPSSSSAGPTNGDDNLGKDGAPACNPPDRWGTWCETRRTALKDIVEVAASRYGLCLRRKAGAVYCGGELTSRRGEPRPGPLRRNEELTGAISIAIDHKLPIGAAANGEYFNRVYEYGGLDEFDHLVGGTFRPALVVASSLGRCLIEKDSSRVACAEMPGTAFIPSFTGATRVVLGEARSKKTRCAEMPDRSVVCDGGPEPPPGASAAALGRDFACFVVDGEVRCQGKEAYFLVGEDQRSGLRHREVDGVVERLWAGDSIACARLTDGRVFCAGSDVEKARHCMIPYGSTYICEYEPRELVTLRGATELAIAGSTVCGLVGGSLYCGRKRGAK